MNLKKPASVLLIDTDCLVWRYALANHDDMPVDDPLVAAQLAIQQKIQFLMEDTGVPRYKLCLAPPGNPNHRKERPEIVTQLYSWLRETYAEDLVEFPGAETDDILANHHQSDGSTVAVSNDKDFHQLAGWNLHPFTGELRWITPRMASVAYWYQILIGDSADGFGGCPGIGAKKALDIITAVLEHNPEAIAKVCLFTYLSQGATTQDFEVTMRLAHLGEDISWIIPELPPEYLNVLKEIQREP
jgi:hypothetical protein